jgi:hypothetical protein
MNNTRSPSHYIHSLADRYFHFQQLHRQISAIIPSKIPKFCWLRSCGPWIEDQWMQLANESFSQFGEFVPLMVPWVRLWASFNAMYRGWASHILMLLSPDFLYVTLSHNDDGIEGSNDRMEELPDNLLILSQGGKGHVPLLLWMPPGLNPNDFPIKSRYDYDIIFMTGDSHWIRPVIRGVIAAAFGRRAYLTYNFQWQDYYSRGKFIISPRGYGRNSYRLGEVLQMGMIPVYVYNDIPWLPYYDSINWSAFSIVVRWDRIQDASNRISETSDQEVHAMRTRIHQLFFTHFSANAVMKQVMNLLQFGFCGSDLRCARYSTATNDPEMMHAPPGSRGISEKGQPWSA